VVEGKFVGGERERGGGRRPFMVSEANALVRCLTQPRLLGCSEKAGSRGEGEGESGS